jgi:hypothetical protein
MMFSQRSCKKLTTRDRFVFTIWVAQKVVSIIESIIWNIEITTKTLWSRQHWNANFSRIWIPFHVISDLMLAGAMQHLQSMEPPRISLRWLKRRKRPRARLPRTKLIWTNIWQRTIGSYVIDILFVNSIV